MGEKGMYVVKSYYCRAGNSETYFGTKKQAEEYIKNTNERDDYWTAELDGVTNLIGKYEPDDSRYEEDE